MGKDLVKRAVPSFVRQSNKLTWASYSLSMPAKRILDLALADMTDKEAVNGVFVATFHKYATLYPGASRSRMLSDFQAGLKNLLSASIKFKSPVDGYDNRYVPFLESIDAIDEGTEYAQYLITFHEQCRPHLLGFKKEFTFYDLKHCGKFTAPNQKRLYECLCQFRSSGVLSMPSRDFIHSGVFSFSDSVAKNAAIVKRDFINKALMKINENTPLYVIFNDENGRFVFNILSGTAAERAKQNAKKKPIEVKKK